LLDGGNCRPMSFRNTLFEERQVRVKKAALNADEAGLERCAAPSR